MTTSLTPVTEIARAKINLALHVVGRRRDGFHQLDSLVAFADIGDQLTFGPADHMTLDVTGPFAPELAYEHGNLALVAADLMHRTWPELVGPVAIRLTKNLPVAAGIGGGSADAAAVVRGLMRLADFSPAEDEIVGVARQLGADVPVCLQQATRRMGGIGETLQPVAQFPSWPAVLVNPKFPVSTPDVFAGLKLAKGEAAFDAMSALPQDQARASWTSWLSACRNDLEKPASEIVPDIDTALMAIEEQPGCLLRRMSGSGATCFGLFEHRDQARAAARNLTTGHPGWWVCETAIG